jgi:hypothetical protein
MESAKLSGALLVWKGSPLAFAEPGSSDAAAGNESFSAGAAVPERSARGSRFNSKSFLLVAIGAAALAVSGTVELGLRTVGEKTAVPAMASVPATVKPAPEAADRRVQPLPIGPMAAAPPNNGSGWSEQPGQRAVVTRAAGASAAAIAAAKPPTARPAATPAAASASVKPPVARPATPAAAIAAVKPPTTTAGNLSASAATAAPKAADKPAPVATVQPSTGIVTVAVADRAEWRGRGDALFAAGDLDPARQFYQLAAEAGDAQAALQLGETYDPAFLAQVHMAGKLGNPATAAHWYQRATKLGAPGAEVLLQAVMADASPAASE